MTLWLGGGSEEEVRVLQVSPEGKLDAGKFASPALKLVLVPMAPRGSTSDGSREYGAAPLS